MPSLSNMCLTARRRGTPLPSLPKIQAGPSKSVIGSLGNIFGCQEHRFGKQEGETPRTYGGLTSFIAVPAVLRIQKSKTLQSSCKNETNKVKVINKTNGI